MKLLSPFLRLPVRFDAARLAEEASRLTAADWTSHPTGFKGNTAARLISVSGAENDDFIGSMAPTSRLMRCEYVRQVLASFGVVWSRSRLMRLAPGAEVPEHSDVNYHWFHRVRLHIPIQTDPAVRFICGGEAVHMAEGEAWLFDNWRKHSVHNDSSRERIHLVADTTGSADFWTLASRGQQARFEGWPGEPPRVVPFNPAGNAMPLLERFNLGPVMHPSEVEQLTADLLDEIAAPQDADQQRAHRAFYSLASGFCREWRQLWTLFSDSKEGWPHFAHLRQYAIEEADKIPPLVHCSVNGMNACQVWHPRVLLYACRGATQAAELVDLDRTVSNGNAKAAPPPKRHARIHSPVFIMAAPRSGSSFLFETLSQAKAFCTLGGESHGLIEGLPQLRPEAANVGSNRLTAAHVDDAVRRHIFEGIDGEVRQRDGTRPNGTQWRFLEKTPKNALRIPFFKALFPDARFIFLWRDPRENISSIIDAWNSGGWITYPELAGWGGPWSLLLPPGWRALHGRPLEEIAAFQWRRTNEIILDDLSRLDPAESISVNYADLVARPAEVVRRLTDFAGVEVDPELADYLGRPLPLSAHTLEPPIATKWRKNVAMIERILPSVDALERTLHALRR